MLCPACQTAGRKFGKDRTGNQRYQCSTCRKTFSERPDRPIGDMRLSLDKALLCLQLLVEGNSIRSTVRIGGVAKRTILDLLQFVGVRCESMLSGRIQNMPVADVQCDEVWGFVATKEIDALAAKHKEAIDVELKDHKTPADWAKEGFALAVEFAYEKGMLKPANADTRSVDSALPTTGANYAKDAGETARIQVYKSGKRLAEVVREVLVTN